MSIIPIKQYSINGGLDMKFDEDMPSGLKGLVKEDQWDVMIRECNRRLMKNRCKKKDIACLVAAPACLLTLVPFMVRYKKHQKRSKMILIDVASLWNEQHPLVRLKFDRHSAGLAFHLQTPEQEEEGKSPALLMFAQEQEILQKRKGGGASKPAAKAKAPESDDESGSDDDEPAKPNASSDDPWAEMAKKN